MRLGIHLRQTFAVGVVFLVPLVLTYLILRFVFGTIDSVLGPFLYQVIGITIPGLGVISLLVLLYLVGLIGRNVVGRQAVEAGQRALLRVPIVSTVYAPVKQLVDSFSQDSTTGFQRVVAITYPREGSWTIGFLTAITRDEEGRELGVVYIPTTPTPNSGWVILAPMTDVYDTNLSVPEAMRMVFSGGIVTPPFIAKERSAP